MLWTCNLSEGKSSTSEPLERGKSTITNCFSTIRLIAGIGFPQLEKWELGIKNTLLFSLFKRSQNLTETPRSGGRWFMSGLSVARCAREAVLCGKDNARLCQCPMFFFRQGLNLAGLRWARGAWVKWRAMGFSLWQLCWLARRICWLWWSSWTFSGVEMAGIKENMVHLGLNMAPDKWTPRLCVRFQEVGKRNSYLKTRETLWICTE